jgi:hypothetical protein
MAKHPKRREEQERLSSRRVFLQRAAGTGLVTAAGVTLIPGTLQAGSIIDYIHAVDALNQSSGTGGPPAGGLSANDIDILNFALTVERLEAAFYNQNAGKTYLTGTNQGTTLTATLVSAQQNQTQNPTAQAAGTGFAVFTLSPDNTQLFYNLRTVGLTGTPTAVELRQGTSGVNGNALYTLQPIVNNSTTGTINLNSADVNALLNQGIYLNIATQANPTGEIRGQVVATPSGIFQSNTSVLSSIVNEIQGHENAHVALLEQMLGTNAAAAPTFQNLDAPTLQQFLQMAQMFEDVGTSAYLGQIPLIQDKNVLATAGGIMAVEGRHAGGLRAYRKVASTAEGGDPNTTLTEDGESVNRARTRDQVLTIIQPYIQGLNATNPGGTTGGTTTGATTGTTTGGTTGVTTGTTTGGTTTGATTGATTGTTTGATTGATTGTTTTGVTTGATTGLTTGGTTTTGATTGITTGSTTTGTTTGVTTGITTGATTGVTTGTTTGVTTGTTTGATTGATAPASPFGPY